MDVAYNQHAKQARRKNRSSTNLSHLSLAPLTSRLPLADHDDLPDAPLHNLSYLQGKSAPTSPGLIGRTPATARSRSRGLNVPLPSAGAALQKSKSASHLATATSDLDRTIPSQGRQSMSGTTSPNASRRRRAHGGAAVEVGFVGVETTETRQLSVADRSDSDWLLRVGALISTETREYKGQAWLVSRASSTSLTGMRDANEDIFERELARERELAGSTRHHSRRGSVTFADDEMSPSSSRRGSRAQSRAGSRNQSRLFTPLDRNGEDGASYFLQHHGHGTLDGELAEDEFVVGPDFVNLDERLEAIEQVASQEEEEAAIRRLVKSGKQSTASGTWVGSLIGWSLFSVEENDEDTSASEAGQADEDDEVEGADGGSDAATGTEGLATASSTDSPPRKGSLSALTARQFDGLSTLGPEERIPPPTADDEGGWKDAAWLLSVASKVLL